VLSDDEVVSDVVRLLDVDREVVELLEVD